MGIKLVGTGHILARSVEEVSRAVSEVKPAYVAVELDIKRFSALSTVDFKPERYEGRFSVKDALHSLGGGSFPVFLQMLLALVQRDLGKKYGISPGSDMCAAVLAARASGAAVVLIDRDIEVTMSRLLAVPLKEFMGLFSGGKEAEGFSKLALNNLDDILEKENLEVLIGALHTKFPGIYGSLIEERDEYMAHMLHKLQIDNPGTEIVAVVGAGHLQGIMRVLKEINSGGKMPDINQLSLPKPVPAYKGPLLAFCLVVGYILIKCESFLSRILGRSKK